MAHLLPLVALLFTLGILGAPLRPAPPGWVTLGASAFLVGILVLALGRPQRPLLFLLLLLSLAAAAGWGAGSLALAPRRPDCHVAHHTGQKDALVTAKVTEEATATPSGQRQVVTAESLHRAGKQLALCGRIELRRLPQDAPLRPGERVLFRGRLKPAGGRRNPGAPSSRLRHLGADVGAIARIESGALLVLEDASRPSLLARLRARIRVTLSAAIGNSGARRVVTALVLGDTASLGAELRSDYARAGVSHLLAVSGLHLSLVAFGFLSLMRFLLLRLTPVGRLTDPRRVAALPACLVAVGYTALAGAPPSAVRSCIMACTGFAGLLFSRPPDLTRPLALAALGLLAWDPLYLFSASFQLSFLCMISIALVMLRPQPLLARTRLGAVARWLRSSLLTTTATTLLTAPVVAHHFQVVSVGGILTNLIAIPLTTLALMPLSLVGSLVGAIHPDLGTPVLAAAGWLAFLLNRLCHWVAACPLSAFELHLGWLGALAALALGVALLARRWLRRVSAFVGIILLAASAWQSASRWQRAELELTLLDVGQGDSTFVRAPDGFSMLVDGGGSLVGSYDPGAAQVVPFLRSAGARRLDLVVLSHPHPDHAAGLLAVLRSIPVGELWICWHGERDRWLDPLVEEARRRGVRVTSPRPMEHGRLRLRPLWPAGHEGQCADRGYDGNDNSVVLRLEYGSSSALLAGDISEEVERRLVREGALLGAHLLKVPHHGSPTSSSTAFIEAVSPRLAVISCGAQNSFGFPAPRVLERYERAGVPVARTDLLGAIEVRLTLGGALSWQPATGAVP